MDVELSENGPAATPARRKRWATPQVILSNDASETNFTIKATPSFTDTALSQGTLVGS